jgi:hypothetical protein
VTTTRGASAIAKKQLDLRNHLWPNAESLLWHRKANKGFATIPKTMPLLLQIMDEMTNGAPVSNTYLGLWCNTWDNSYVSVAKTAELAFAAGFTGQRAEHTWAARMKKLQELHFIDIKAGKSGPMSHVVLWNPHMIIRYHHDVAKTPGMTEASFTSLLERAMEVGADDMLRNFDGTGVVASPEGPVPQLLAMSAAATAAAATSTAVLLATPVAAVT